MTMLRFGKRVRVDRIDRVRLLVEVSGTDLRTGKAEHYQLHNRQIVVTAEEGGPAS